MNRSIIYSGAQGRTFDLLNAWRDALEGFGQLEGAIAGANTTVVSGLAGSQTTSPSMTINLAAGWIAQQAAVDATAYGSLSSDADLIQQLGYAAAQSVLLTTNALSAGQSQWALIECQFAQVDVIRAGDPTGGLLYYYNSANPTQPLQGPGGNGQTQNTEREATLSVRVTYGTPATTGSEVPPAVSTGWAGLFLIDLVFGQSTITNGQILVAGPSVGANVPSNYPARPLLAGLLRQHHRGTAGQAPQIDLTSEVQNVLPLPNLPASHTLGGLPTMRLFAGNPNGNVAGNFNVNGAADFVWDSSGKILYVCTATGNAAAAVWSAVVGQATSQFAGGTSGGSANAQTIASTTPAGFALTAGYVVNFTAGFANTGAATLNVDATGAIAINKTSGGGPIPIVSGDIALGAFVSVIYTGTVYLIQSAQLGQLATLNLGQWVKNDGAGNLTLNVASVFQDNGSGALTLNATNATAILNAFVGDSGSGGTKGEVPAPAANDAVLKKVLGAGGAWVQQGPTVVGSFSDLVIVNGGAPDTQMVLTANALGLRNASTGEVATVTGVNITGTLTNSGAGGLDTGSPAASTGYFIHVIFNPATQMVAMLYSVSATAPTLPSGYTFSARYGWNITDGSTRFLRVKQTGRRVQPVVTAATNTPHLPILVSGNQGGYDNTAPSWNTIPLTGHCPATASEIIIVYVGQYNSGTAGNVCIAPSASYAGRLSTNPPWYDNQITTGTLADGCVSLSMMLEAASFQMANNSSGVVLLLGGYIDNL